MIDLHLHTTASDGLDSPAALVSRAKDAGITAIAVTDHDTVAAVSATERLASAAGIAFVPGIEITAVWEEVDVHVLGYFVDTSSDRLGSFLDRQRVDRLRRARLMAAKLSALGAPLDVERLIAGCRGRVMSRPLLAQAMVDAGLVSDVAAAFDRFLGEGKAAYVPRTGATPVEVVAIVNAAGGISSLAHPAVTGRDDLIPGLVAGGLGAIEVFHPEHSPADVARYAGIAREYGLAVSGGSDFHGDASGRFDGFGSVGLSDGEFAALCARAGRPVPHAA